VGLFLEDISARRCWIVNRQTRFSSTSMQFVSGYLYGFSVCYSSLVDVYTDMSIRSHINWFWYVMV